MRIRTAAILAFSLAAGLPAAAFDLTGHWEGSYSCSEFDRGIKYKFSNKESTLTVTSLGNGTLRTIVDGFIDFRGIEIPDATESEKGEIGLVYCGSDDDLATGAQTEFGRFKVSTSGSRGSISGSTVWSYNYEHIATCKYRYTRVDTIDPNLTYACP